MRIKITQPEGTNQILLRDGKNNLLKSFELKENFQRALRLLKQINSLKTLEGKPIYETEIFKGVSIWSFHQQKLFYPSLCDYVKYEPVIKFLTETGIRKVKIEGELKKLPGFLRMSGFIVSNSSNRAGQICLFFISSFIKLVIFLVNIFAFLKLFLGRIEVLVYTPDRFSKKYGCDFRFQAVYNHLDNKKVPYLEIFQTSLGTRFLKNLLKRRRLAVYLSGFPMFCAQRKNDKYELSIFESHNQKYFIYLLRKIAQESEKSVRRIRILSWFLKFTKIKTLLAMDDVRYTNELIVACRINNIKTLGFQHGQFTKYHAGWMNYDIPKELSIVFDKLFVWNNYWKKILLRYSSQYNEENVEIGGLLSQLKIIDYKKREEIIKNISNLNILAPYESYAPKKEVGIFLERFIELGVKIFFKARPDLSPQYQLNQYKIKLGENVELVEDINSQILSKIDAVVGTYSTFLNEMIFYEKPLLILETSLDLGHCLIEDNLGLLIKKNFEPSFLLDYINNYQSKKEIAWPPSKIRLEEILEGLNL